MGVDFLDITWRLEKEFEVKLSQSKLIEILETRRNANPESFVDDVRVCEFVLWVERAVRLQNPTANRDVFERIKKHLIATLCVDEDEVTPDAWLDRDLGMS